MAVKPKYPKDIITFFLYWKDSWKKAKGKKRKFTNLIVLAQGISVLYNKIMPKCELSTSYLYKEGTIFLGPKPSIISTLHEIGHHLYGPSELKACRFSVHLFKRIFPEAKDHLHWEGHMLIRNPKTMNK